MTKKSAAGARSTPSKRGASRTVAKKPTKGLARSTQAKSPRPSTLVYQIKITLTDSGPPIWRGIETKDCTLDKLHEQIQTAMGWTNSHLHHFELDGQLYGDPFLMGDNYREFGYKNSSRTKLSDLAPPSGRGMRLDYEYDFGDSWHHDILLEKVKPAEPGVVYPRCIAGARACPPEDIGGIWGYAEFLEAMANRSHERHSEFIEWIGGPFDPEQFDPEAATSRMQDGLPDWRKMV